MKVQIDDIRQGHLNGEKVWICHYNQPDLDKKPLRNLPPTQVLIRSNEELPKGKRVYYSESHFVPLGKNGQPLSKVISPMDNTGYRSNPGNPVSVFRSELECIAQWNTELQQHIEQVDVRIANAAKYWQNCKQELLDARVVYSSH